MLYFIGSIVEQLRAVSCNPHLKMSKARGDTETAQLKNNIQSQLNRFISV